MEKQINKNNLGYSQGAIKWNRAINTDACYLITEILIVWSWHIWIREISIYIAN